MTISLRAAMGLGLDDPFEPAGMGFGGIAAHDDGQIRIADVRPGICHRAATERRAQTGHRRSVSDARLIVERQNARGRGRPCRSGTRSRWWWPTRRGSRRVVQRLTVTPSLFLVTKFLSRSSFIVRAMRSSASSQETRSNLSDPGLRTSDIAGASPNGRSPSAPRPSGRACRDWSDGRRRLRCG